MKHSGEVMIQRTPYPPGQGAVFDKRANENFALFCARRLPVIGSK